MAHLQEEEHEKFCAYLYMGDSQIAAYKKAFNLDIANENPSSLRSYASKLANSPEIRHRLEEMRQDKALWTKEQAVKTLLEVIEEGNATATLNAVKQLNTMFGFTEAKIEEEEQTNSIEVAIVPTIGLIDKHEEYRCKQE